MIVFISLYLHLAALVWAGAFGIYAATGSRAEQLVSGAVSVGVFLVASTLQVAA